MRDLESIIAENAKAEARYLDAPAKSKPIERGTLKTYSVIGRYYDNSQVFHDCVAAESAKDAVDKVQASRNPEPDHPYSGSCPLADEDWELIAVLTGDRIEDVTPSEYIV